MWLRGKKIKTHNWPIFNANIHIGGQQISNNYENSKKSTLSDGGGVSRQIGTLSQIFVFLIMTSGLPNMGGPFLSPPPTDIFIPLLTNFSSRASHEIYHLFKCFRSSVNTKLILSRITHQFPPSDTCPPCGGTIPPSGI